MATTAAANADSGRRLEAIGQRRRFAGVRDRLATSHLVRGGGVLRGRLVDAPTLDDLRADAFAAHSTASEAKVTLPRRPDQRGDPDRWLESAPGGPPLGAFAGSAGVLQTLSRATGLTWEPAGSGSWSYYRRTGHHLGLHRDLAVCDLAVITCVVDEGARGASGALRVWPGRLRDDLDDLRSDPRGGLDLHLSAGDSVLLLGGIVPHRVLPLAEGHVRIVTPLCYRIVGEAPLPVDGAGSSHKGT